MRGFSRTKTGRRVCAVPIPTRASNFPILLSVG
jgi:hypothetical protein